MNRHNLNSKGGSSKTDCFGAVWMALTVTSVPWCFMNKVIIQITNYRFVSTATLNVCNH